MELGLLTDSLSTMTRAEALDTAVELGIDTVEIGLGGDHGGWSPAPHADLHELLTDAGARATLRRDVTSRGLRLEAFNAAERGLHTRPARVRRPRRQHPAPGTGGVRGGNGAVSTSAAAGTLGAEPTLLHIDSTAGVPPHAWFSGFGDSPRQPNRPTLGR